MMLFRAALAGDVTLLVMDQLLDEVHRKAITKPTFVSRIPLNRTIAFITDVRSSSVMLPTLLPPFPRICRDPKDDYLLAYAESGHTDFLVTYDEDLLVLDGRFPFRVVRPPDFLTILREQGLA